MHAKNRYRPSFLLHIGTRESSKPTELNIQLSGHDSISIIVTRADLVPHEPLFVQRELSGLNVTPKQG